MYSSIDNESFNSYSSCEDQSRSRGDSAASEGSVSSSLPILPESRSPIRSYSLSAGSYIPQQYSESIDADVLENSDLPMERSMRKMSAPESMSNFSSSGIICAMPTYSKQFSLHSFDEFIETNKQRHYAKKSRIPKCHLLISTIVVVGMIIVSALAIGIFCLIKIPNSKHPLTSTTAYPFARRNETYDCVNGSIAKVLLDLTLYPLAELNLPEQYPTFVMESLEYLVVPQYTKWWYAQKYCTAWCGYLVSIKGPEENANILEMVKEHLGEFSNYWIGLKAWSNKWYLDDESKISYFNFADPMQAIQDMLNSDNLLKGCGQANGNGLWSISDCDTLLPFVCERNTADPNMQRTPFAPHQEEKCQNVGGMCKLDKDCVDGVNIKNHCPDQPNNILCCIQKKPKPAPSFNSTARKCEDLGGICNHVDADQCRGGRVVFDLAEQCPDSPRSYNCCVENGEFS